MRNKQEGLENFVWLQGHDLTMTMETRWDNLHNWNAVMHSYVIFKKEKPARWGDGVAQQQECVELCLGMNYEWVRIKGQDNMGDTIVSVYYRTPDQEMEVY